MELNRDQIKNEIQSLIKALKDCGGWVKRGNGEGWFNHEILADALALITEQEQRIGELEAENERLRADTVREFAERLKAEMSFGRYIQADQIDQIAKEMEDED